MKSVLILVGKTTDKHLSALIDDYVSRIGHYMPFEVVCIPELKNTKSLSEDQQRDREGEQILKKVQSGDTLYLLDERGDEYSSVGLARWLERQQVQSKRLLFVIGGP